MKAKTKASQSNPMKPNTMAPELTTSKHQAAITAANAKTPLLSLPGELRNMIYEMTALEGSVFWFEPNGKIKYKSSLECVSKQIRQEFLPMLHHVVPQAMKGASRIAFPVHDFDFNEVTSFIKSLSKSELHALESNDSLQIILFQASEDFQLSTNPRLTEWWHFCNRTFTRHLTHSARYIWVTQDESAASFSPQMQRYFERQKSPHAVSRLSNIARKDGPIMNLENMRLSEVVETSIQESADDVMQRIMLGPPLPSKFKSAGEVFYPDSPHWDQERNRLLFPEFADGRRWIEGVHTVPSRYRL